MRTIRLSLFFVLIAAASLSTVGARAQQTTSPNAPVPAALYTAKKVFISNGGMDSGLIPETFSGDSDRAYNEFYADVQGLGRYELVTDPEDADLVFELRVIAPNGPATANTAKETWNQLPMFRLVIYDRKSHYVLWTLTEPIQKAMMQKAHDKNFDESLGMLVQYLKQLTTQVPAVNP